MLSSRVLRVFVVMRYPAMVVVSWFIKVLTVVMLACVCMCVRVAGAGVDAGYTGEVVCGAAGSDGVDDMHVNVVIVVDVVDCACYVGIDSCVDSTCGVAAGNCGSGVSAGVDD